MNAECLVELLHDVERNVSDQVADSLDGNGSDLFGLGLGVDGEPGLVGGEQRLERVDVIGVRSDRNYGDHAAPESLSRGVRAIVADDHGRARACGLVALRRRPGLSTPRSELRRRVGHRRCRSRESENLLHEAVAQRRTQ